MVSLLFMISFLLHIVLLMAVYRLFRQLQQEKQQNNEQLETLAETLLAEMKLVNQALEQKQASQTESGSAASHEQPVPRKEASSYETKSKPIVKTEVAKHAPAFLEEKAEEKREAFEPSIEGKALQLANQGYTTEEIAKKLARGKTEVELMLKMMQHKS